MSRNMEILLSGKPSDLNIKLISFLKTNLYELNNASIIFSFTIVDSSNVDVYKKKGVVNFPVLLYNNMSITGAEKIIKYLNINSRKQITQSVKIQKSDTDYVDDFWKETMGNVTIDESGKLKPDDDDDEHDEGKDLHHKIQKAFEERNQDDTKVIETHKSKNIGGSTPVNKSSSSKPNYRSNNITESPTETLKNMKSKGGSNMDDELMSKFFENQEESI